MLSSRVPRCVVANDAARAEQSFGHHGGRGSWWEKKKPGVAHQHSGGPQQRQCGEMPTLRLSTQMYIRYNHSIWWDPIHPCQFYVFTKTIKIILNKLLFYLGKVVSSLVHTSWFLASLQSPRPHTLMRVENDKCVFIALIVFILL